MSFYHFLAQTSSSTDNANTIANGIAALIALIISALPLGLLIWSLYWVYNDAERRGKSGCLVVLIIILFGWPVSFLLWFIFRP